MRLPFLKKIDQRVQQPGIIGLAGHKGSGKDTFFRLFSAGTTLDVKRDAFADRLKISAAHALGFRFDALEEYLEWADQMKNDGIIGVAMTRGDNFSHRISGRQFLQFYGTEAHREVFGTDFWVDQLLSDPLGAIGDADLLVITDVRFPNEAKAIQGLGGEVWRVNREADTASDSHASEKPLPEEFVDLEINNEGTLTELAEAAQALAALFEEEAFSA